MEITVQGHGLELTDPLREYAIKKIGKVKEFFNDIIKVQVVLDLRDHSDINRSHVAEVTLWAAGKKVIHASEAGKDMYAAIDLVSQEIDRQVKKHKEKHTDEIRRSGEKIKQAMRETSETSL